MPDIISSNKTIAKNTILLYVRMGVTMLITLYTSRVILQVVGVSDMGIQATVGGLVSFIGFINAALGNGTSRFLMFSLGKGNKDEMSATFSTTFWVHTALAIVIALIVEIFGVWFLYNKLVIPLERMDAAVWCFHLSVMTMVVTMMQVPYNASIIAHERMNIYAYISMAEVVLKLGIVYSLVFVDFDKLKLYSLLLFLVALSIASFYLWYCTSCFQECKLSLRFNKKIFAPIAKFSGWQLFANIAVAFSNQGILILLNMFFSPAIVTARTISLQVNNAATQFMDSFRTAANPQIVKKYAAGRYDESKNLLIESTKYSYFLILLIGLPIILLSTEILQLWLGQVPDYSDKFLQLVIIQSVVQVFNTGFYTAIYAKGQLKENAISAPLLLFAAFPFVYVMFRFGFSPLALSYAYIASYALQAFIQKPYILVHVVGYNWSDFPPLYIICIKVTLIASVVPVLYWYCSNNFYHFNNILYFISTAAISIISVIATVWIIGIDRCTREKIMLLVKNRIHK